ncbi:uncharacterized protein C8A04DRAFT_30635 [Dichotomopilus funicola]|uniref:Alkyl hydroperoxide reductase subunit C/ Thiol specific antioxidant domain-containing protein n=1 Tax=Dichotomopilus funicola TaxID=1934379 RepID=A0AAN6UZ77_9PEZI|nr:hypothetical protein C8A04DRAFT_30635 [Dichotomopilus funicola]
MSTTSTPNPVETFDEIVRSSTFTFLLYYRGHWCPFCIAHLKQLVALTPEIKAAGGTVIAATAEIPKHLDAVRKATGFTDTVVVDPENVLAAELKKRGLLDIAVTPWRGYEWGLAQPGFLVVRGDGRVMGRWAVVPALMNLAGAKDRPVLAEVWEDVRRQLKGEDTTEGKVYTTTGAFHLLKQKIFG